MSDWTVENENLYDLPPVVLNEFTRVMDTISKTEWVRFASSVISDQTELRLMEQTSEGRTDRLINYWGNRNGTVGDLLEILEKMKMLRARDIILNWIRSRMPRSHSKLPSLPPVDIPDSPPSSLFTHSTKKDLTKLPPSSEPVLPAPGPPPAHLESLVISTIHQPPCPCPSVWDPAPLSTTAMCWEFEEVQRGTENFSAARQIGEGGFGHVYRATMRNTDYAVKKLKEDSQLDWSVVKESFKTEVEKLSQYRHPNIMDFAGYSVGGGAHCILYGFMPNGSLEDRLQASDALSWQQRVSVLLGSAKAIQFLHSCSPKLIHGDIKSSNILLGEHLEAKLGDFGLARFCRSPSRAAGKTTTVAQTKTVRGTLAYLPDEYLKNGELGVEIDVYSFGVVSLEVLTGRRALQIDSQSKAVYLKDLVTEVEDEGDGGSQSAARLTQEQSLSQAAEHICRKHQDPRVARAGTPGPHGALDISLVACRCLDRRKKKRPPMAKVFETLKEVHSGLAASDRSVVISVCPSLPRPSSPQPLFSAAASLDSITHQFSKLGPQEDTYYAPQNAPYLSLPLSRTQSEGPTTGGSVGTWGTQNSSSRTPCESDESQGYSQYSVSTPSSHSSGNAPLQHRRQEPESGSSYGASQAGGSQASSTSGLSSQKIVVNPVRKRFVQKMALYDEGRIPTSELLSSDTFSYGRMSAQTREPEESDEFASVPGEASGNHTNASL